MIEGTTNGEHELEEYLNLYNGFLSDITFFEDYTNSYHIDDDIQIFKLRGLEIDTMRIEYLKDGLFQQRSEKKTTKKTIPEPKQNPVANSTLEEEKSFDQSIKIQSLVANVRDLFPQLGTGFLAKCLPYFDNNPENVINALLEDNLPPHLANLDRTMEFTENEPAKIQEKPVEHKREEESNDHFHGMELSKLHRGKKSKAKNANALLEDKRELLDAQECELEELNRLNHQLSTRKSKLALQVAQTEESKDQTRLNFHQTLVKKEPLILVDEENLVENPIENSFELLGSRTIWLVI